MCPTEIIAFSDRAEEFLDLNTQLIAGSTDTEEVTLEMSCCMLLCCPLLDLNTQLIASSTNTNEVTLGLALLHAVRASYERCRSRSCQEGAMHASALSCGGTERTRWRAHAQSHMAWIKTPRKKGGLGAMKIPIIADVTKAGAHFPSAPCSQAPHASDKLYRSRCT